MHEQPLPNDQLTYDKLLLRGAIGDFQELRDIYEFEATADIDMVWVLAGHGTYDSPATVPPYDPGVSYDRMSIDRGINLVYEVTALRTGKDIAEVTKDDIAEHGPMFYYNGESAEMPGVRYLHNEALARAVEDPDFPLPPSKVVIDYIDRGNTPAQMEGYAKFRDAQVAAGETPAQKIAVVSLPTHLPRTGRYITHYGNSFQGDPTFVQVPVPFEGAQMTIIMGEARRILAYYPAGYLAAQNGFAHAIEE